ncbi:MAG TPA: acetylxylan esterase [Candidatus Latescibacteria bacterium]|nr:acetylxylan esterase [Candidatus Latescibacterota bacterium]
MAGSRNIRRSLDSLKYSLFRYERQGRKLAFRAETAEGARAWQAKLRRKLKELLGGFPPRVPLEAEVVERSKLDGYIREAVYFQSREGLWVFAYFLLPEVFQAPGPVVVCLPGHGQGADAIVGIAEEPYQANFALQCVEHGFAALALEQLGFGCRRDERARKEGAGKSSCQPAAGAALLFGETMIGWRVWDAIRAIDYLQTRPEVDLRRIGVMGISGGGTTTFFTAALDRRVKAAVVSGYFNTFRDSILSIPHCMDNYIPGILKYAEMYDIAGLIAPRGLFVESGTKDSIFPIEATRFAFEQARRVWAAFGAEDRLELEVFEGEHQFWGKGAFKFLKRML